MLSFRHLQNEIHMRASILSTLSWDNQQARKAVMASRMDKLYILPQLQDIARQIGILSSLENIQDHYLVTLRLAY